ncbi:MAG: alpha/beta hydrolase, partial [Actinobacteria bacterium]|nr:alpha/beta hydrolase [Actinomycetota bacterium]
IRDTSIEVIADFFPLFQEFDAFEALRVLKKVPTEFFCGLADRLTPPDHTSTMGEQVPKARVHLLPKTGHLLMLERPDQVTESIVRLVRDEA